MSTPAQNSRNNSGALDHSYRQAMEHAIETELRAWSIVEDGAGCRVYAKGIGGAGGFMRIHGCVAIALTDAVMANTR